MACAEWRIAACGVAGGLALCGQASAVTLYDIDFSSPVHSVGAEPTVGAGPFPRETISEIKFGSPQVVAGEDSLADQPLVLSDGEPTGFGSTYEQIQLDLGQNADLYELEFDLFLSGFSLESSDSFALQLDRAGFEGFTALGFDVANGLRYSLYGPGTDIGLFGSWNQDVVMSVRVEADVANDWLRWFVDDVEVKSSPWAASDLATLRLNLTEGTAAGGPQAQATLDNLVIRAIPEPSAGALLFTALALSTLAHGRPER